MARTHIRLDDDSRLVTGQVDLQAEREAADVAGRSVAGEGLDDETARRARGSGWDGDLDEMRASRTA